MRKLQNVSLIGLGAIGGAYGSQLQKLLGNQFRVIVNEERLNRYNQNVFLINGVKQDFHFVTPEEEGQSADLVIIATKNAELKQAIQDARNHISTNTIILSLLNGISSEDDIFKATGNNHILYSMCVGIDAVRENQQIHYSSLGKICFGEKNKTVSNDVLAVKQLFDEAAVPYEISADILHAVWAKFMFNVGINQASAVLRAPYKHFQEVRALHEWMESAMYEVVAISKEVGVHLTEEDVLHYRPILKKLSPEGKTSMLQDVEAFRKTEVEYFAGKVCELGKQYGIPTPINDQLLNLILIIEEMAKHRRHAF